MWVLLSVEAGESLLSQVLPQIFTTVDRYRWQISTPRLYFMFRQDSYIYITVHYGGERGTDR